MLINDGWSFCKEGESAVLVTLPHDAMLYEKRTEKCHNGVNSGYFPGGKYVYEKELLLSEADTNGKNIQLYFEGVYQRAKVYCNDKLVKEHAYGFTPFYADITDCVDKGQNHIRVTVDNSLEPNCRWYSGSGIYRNVHLLIRDRNYIDEVRVQTISVNPAVIQVDAYTAGESRLQCKIIGKHGEGVNEDLQPVAGELNHYRKQLLVPNALLWSVDTPDLYDCTVTSDTDSFSTKFGIRSISCSAKTGLLLNGEEVLLRGGCIHSDNGVLGACSYRDAEFRKVKILKEAGYNAIRCAHNPACRDFLDACDELGMLVLDEAFDGWYTPKTYHDYSRFFHENWRTDLEAMVRVDFNHPSVILQSIGNEVSETADEKGVQMAGEMAEYLKKLDGTRPVTAGINVLLNVYANMGMGVYKEKGIYKPEKLPEKKNGYKDKKTGSAFFNAMAQKLGPLMFYMSKGRKGDKATKTVAEKLDITGLNYAASRYDSDTKKYPDRVMLGTETIISELPYNWRCVKKHKAVIGDFAWAAWDYIGEAGIGDYMYYSYEGLPLLAGSGAIDISGNIGPEAVFEQIVWGLRKDPYIAVTPLNHAKETPKKSAWRFTGGLDSWNWPGYEGQKANVEVYSDAPIVRLYLNDELIGENKVRNYRAAFSAKYAPGILKAVAVYENDTRTFCLTTGEGKVALQAEIIYRGEEISYVEITARDEKGMVVPVCEDKIEIIHPDYELIGFGSARTKTNDSYVSNVTHLYRGRALAVFRGKIESSKLVINSMS